MLASGCESILGGTPVDLCANPCEEELCEKVDCDPAVGCVYTPAPGPCDDGSVCTTKDSCKEGECTGIAVKCDDDNPCTSDTCVPAKACTFKPKTGPCDDGKICTDDDTCSGGKCVGDKKSCDDGDVCTDDVCTSGVGCEHSDNTAPCTDGDKCTQGDTCESGACVPGEPLVCNDGNGCTDDSCSKKKGCRTLPNGDDCDDGDVCTPGDACGGGVCLAGKLTSCDDDNVCTSESCDSKGGCLYEATDEKCLDDDECTASGKCKLGNCIGFGAVDCSDDNPCTGDDCDPVKGCLKPHLSIDCDDGKPCTEKSTCEGGKCEGWGVVDCDDGNLCTNDACSTGKGCVFVQSAGACEDGDPCTVGESCVAGMCASGPPTECNSCGNGAVNVHTGKAPPACPDPMKLTIAKDMKGFKKWLATPTTSLQIVGKYAFKGADLHLGTACDVTLSPGARLDGVGHAVVYARKLSFEDLA